MPPVSFGFFFYDRERPGNTPEVDVGRELALDEVLVLHGDFVQPHGGLQELVFASSTCITVSRGMWNGR